MDSTVNTVRDLLSLSGQTVLITGASGYLGTAMSQALAEAGASVVITSRDQNTAQELASQLPVVGAARHYGVTLDHMDEGSIREGFAEALRQAGSINSLIANGHEPLGKDWTNVTADEFDRHMRNATGYFLLARELRNHRVAVQEPGSIVLVGSMYGLVGSYPDAYDGLSAASPIAYHALKGGIIQMTRHLAVYWAKDQIRVNCLSPGPFPSDKAPTGLSERLAFRSPMARMGRPEELKAPVVFLCSRGASYMTGQNLVIDGGWTAW